MVIGSISCLPVPRASWSLEPQEHSRCFALVVGGLYLVLLGFMVVSSILLLIYFGIWQLAPLVRQIYGAARLVIIYTVSASCGSILTTIARAYFYYSSSV